MNLLEIFRNSPEFLQEKSVKQIIGIAGNGKLLDGSSTSQEFTALLAEISSNSVARYAEDCISDSFSDNGFALQDILNEIGRRLGFRVTNGRYRGVKGEIGHDGLWELPNKQKIIVEIKTTDAYRIDLDVIAGYRRALIKSGQTTEETSSILMIVGRADTGDLEAQIRGSRHAWDMRLISIDALLRLMLIRESVDEPKTLCRIHEVLIPREFTKLDDIVDLVFSTTEEVKQLDEQIDMPSLEEAQAVDQQFDPVSISGQSATRIANYLGVSLLKRSRISFSTPDEFTQVICAVSKKYSESKRSNYWFAFHPHQKEKLEKAQKGFIAFGCGSANLIFLIPIEKFTLWLDGMNKTVKDERFYWHVLIHNDSSNSFLIRKKGQERVDLTLFKI